MTENTDKARKKKRNWGAAIILALLLVFGFFQFVVHPSRIELKDFQVYLQGAERLHGGDPLYGSLSSKEEYKTIVKVSGLGILAIGLIGFLVSMLKEVFLG